MKGRIFLIRITNGMKKEMKTTGIDLIICK